MTSHHDDPGDAIRRLVAENEDSIERLFDRYELSREERGELLFDALVLFGVRRQEIGDPGRWLLEELEHRCERRRSAREDEAEETEQTGEAPGSSDPPEGGTA
jgi:hypothetical protein